MRSVVYFIREVGDRGPVKIGSTTAIERRLAHFECWSPCRLYVAATIPGDYRLEARFHAHFREDHSHGEWFKASPELDSVIEAIRAGAFDTDALPDGGDFWRRSVIAHRAWETRKRKAA